MKPCVLIPCYNHAATVGAVARAALAHCPVIVVDDGSIVSLPELPGCTVLRLERNGGKAAALRAGFQRAMELGFSRAITMDADGQHFAEDLPQFLAVAAAQPNAYAVGVRDFRAAGCPTHRRRSNAVSTFWFRVETGVKLADTQCGFRCYPLTLTQQLKIRSNRYAFELEFMVRASWIGTPIVAVPVKCTYEPQQVGQSHFRPVRDLAHITLMNVGLVLQSWFVPESLRAAWSRGEHKTFRATVREIFLDHAHDPLQLALAVGVGLFFGILPVFGLQTVIALTLAHRWRLNMAITLLACNISLPPMVPFILYAATALGHWMFTGELLTIALGEMTMARAREFVWQWLVGSMVLAVLAAVMGALMAYLIAKIFGRGQVKL